MLLKKNGFCRLTSLVIANQLRNDILHRFVSQNHYEKAIISQKRYRRVWTIMVFE